MNTYENANSRTTRILETFNLFKDKPSELKAMIKLHVEAVYLEGKIAGINERTKNE